MQGSPQCSGEFSEPIEFLEILAMAEFEIRDQLTLLELAKRTNLGDLVTIVEVLEETNEWLQDAIWLEANQTMSHITTQRTSKPTGTWRKINEGVAPEASSTLQIVEGIGILEAYSRVDKLLAELSGNVQQFRSGEDKAFIEGLSENLSDVMFRDATGLSTEALPYGDTVGNPERFNGLPTRMDGVGLANVIDHGAALALTDDTSVYIVQWGEGRVHMIYPKGSPTMGIVHENLGEQTIEASGTYDSPKLMQALVSHFKLHAGLVVRDDRCIRRICSIKSSLDAATTYTFFDTTYPGHHKLIQALNALPYKGKGAVIYANQTIKTQMDILAVDKGNVMYNVQNWSGQEVTTFKGVPIRRVDAITNHEKPL